MNERLLSVLFVAAVFLAVYATTAVAQDSAGSTQTIHHDSEVDFVLNEDAPSSHVEERLRPLAERIQHADTLLVLGEEDGGNAVIFGNILSASLMGESIHVLDGDFNNVRVFDQSGALQAEYGRHGQGPGEFSHPVDIATDRRGNAVVVDRGRRVQLFQENDSEYAYESSFTVDYTPQAVCLMEDEIYIHGYYSDGTDAQTIHVYSRNGGHLRSFGHIFDDGHAALNMTLSRGWSIACHEETATVILAYYYVPFLVGYSTDGDTLWKTRIGDFEHFPIRVATNPQGREEVRHGPADEGTNLIERITRVDENTFLLQISELDYDGPNLLHTYIMDAASGEGFYVGDSIPEITDVNDSIFVGMASYPFPYVLVLE